MMNRFEWLGTKMKLNGVRADVRAEQSGSVAWRVSDGQGRLCEGEEPNETEAKRMAVAMLCALAAALSKCAVLEEDICDGVPTAGSADTATAKADREVCTYAHPDVCLQDPWETPDSFVALEDSEEGDLVVLLTREGGSISRWARPEIKKVERRSAQWGGTLVVEGLTYDLSGRRRGTVSYMTRLLGLNRELYVRTRTVEHARKVTSQLFELHTMRSLSVIYDPQEIEQALAVIRKNFSGEGHAVSRYVSWEGQIPAR